MFERIKLFFVNTIQQELQKRGYEVDQETLNKALANAPHLAQQIQAIWASNEPDKLQRIYELIMMTAQESSTSTSTSTSKSTTKETEGR